MASPSIVPYLSYRNVDAALRFLSDAFGFEVSVRWEDGGVVKHAEITWSGSTVMLGTGDDQTGPVTERSVGHGFYVVVEDVDEHFKRAQEAGAHVVFSPEDTPWGTRRSASWTWRAMSGASARINQDSNRLDGERLLDPRHLTRLVHNCATVESRDLPAAYGGDGSYQGLRRKATCGNVAHPRRRKGPPVSRTRGLCVGLATVAVLTMQVPASAGPFTETEAGKWSETLTNEEWACSDELYDVVTNGHQITHITVQTDENGSWVYPLHFTSISWGRQVAAPSDGTGPSYVGKFRSMDSENIRVLKHGKVVAETDTDLGYFIAKGSDGSRIRQHQHAHFTFNANGDVTVEFETDRARCIAGRG